jgi:hypothetical protein
MNQRTHLRHLLAALCAVSVVLACAAPGASASGYGELTRFGARENQGKTKATKAGFLAGERPEGTEHEEELRYSIGVDPAESNDIFVLDEPIEFKESPKECEPRCTFERHVRIQKLNPTGGFLPPTATFAVTSPQVEEEETESESFSNIAVDPSLGVLYVLSIEPRKYDRTKDNLAPVATTLYAFKTAGLEPAGKTPGSAVLAGPAELQAESEEAGKPLIEPRGLTVDPTTHEVIILGHVDEAGAAEDHAVNDNFALQRVSGEGNLGQRYVDKKRYFQNSTRVSESWPGSPVVTSAGKVLVRFEGIAEIPSAFKEATEKETPPTQVFLEPREKIKSIVSGGEEEDEFGGGMSLSPEGTLYETAGVLNEALKKKVAGNGVVAGVAARSSATGGLVGWSGGATQEIQTLDHCVLEPGVAGESIAVAAGAGESVVVLAPEYLHKEVGVTHMALVVLGPGGLGCPPAAGSTVTLTSESGIAVPESEPIEAGEKVHFSVGIEQADALGAEWTIENVATKEKSLVKSNLLEFNAEPGTGDLLLQQPKQAYEFTAEGKYVVSGKISTDDLATPTLETTQRHVVVKAAKTGGPEPPKVTSQPLSATVTEGTAATFTARASGRPTPTVQWEVSTDGGKTFSPDTTDAGTTTQTLTISNTTTSLSGREYRAVFTNERGKAETTPAKLTVNAKPPPPPPANGGGTAGTGTGASGVLPAKIVKAVAAVPTAKIASSSLTVTRAGVVTLKVTCAAGETRCIGSVTLRTLTAVSAASGKKKKKILTLASGSFSVAGGATMVVKLHLSATARKLLARSHTLRAKATLAAHDLVGAKHTQEQVLTLRLAKH